MGFMDKVKDTAGSAMAALSDAAKDVSDKGREMTEKARLNKSVKDAETRLNNLYQVIGMKFFEAHDGDETVPEGYETLFNGVRNTKAEIEKIKSDITGAAETADACPKCGAKVTKAQAFCPGCGTKLN